MSTRIGFIAALLAAAASAGCSELKEIHYRASAPLNVNPQGKNTPVPVRIYFLKKPDKFTGTAWGDLYKEEDAKKVLGGDMVGEFVKLDVFVNDSKVYLLAKPPPPEVSHVGIYGLFLGSAEGKPRHVAVTVEQAKASAFVFREYFIEVAPK
jgi:type VI secretion system VasD/TssJ family lipoprotein